jgi:hypothetical protein
MVMGCGCGSDGDDSVAVSELIYFLFYHQACVLFQVLQIYVDTKLFNIAPLLRNSININNLKRSILFFFRVENVVIQVYGLDSGGATPLQHWISVL